MLLVWLGALAMLLLLSHDFSKQTLTGKNAGTLMVLAVAWFGWAVLTYALRRQIFGVGEELVERRRGTRPASAEPEPEPEVVLGLSEESQDDEHDTSENWQPREPREWSDRVADSLIERHRMACGAEPDFEWEDRRERMIATFEGQSVEEFKAQVSRRLGVGAFKFLVEAGQAEDGLRAGEMIRERFRGVFEPIGEHDEPMRFVIYEVIRG